MTEVSDNKVDAAYDAENIEVLEGLEPVRERPGMYVGGDDTAGYHHLPWEVIDNSIDEALAGHCDKIDVCILKDGSMRVTDNGRGIPVAEHPAMKKSAATVVLTVLHAGGKFNGGGYKVSGGLHGVGVSVVNALSSELDLEVKRDGYVWRQSFVNGGKEVAPLKRFEKSSDTGTSIRFMPDDTIFSHEETGEAIRFDTDTILQSIEARSYLNPGVTFTFEDQREGLVKEFLAQSFSEILTTYSSQERDYITETMFKHDTVSTKGKSDSDVDVEVFLAMRYHTKRPSDVRSFCNNIVTPEGGTHDQGFRSALLKTINDYGLGNKLIKSRLVASDVAEGLEAAISVRIPDPKFKGQTKDKLANTECVGAVNKVTSSLLKEFLEENPKVAKNLIKRAEQAAKGRIAADKAREVVERKSVLGSNSMPGKLSDCQSNNPEECELYIVEGDSAGGSAKQGRESRFQAILPLKGKPMNTQKKDNSVSLNSEEIKNIITAMGTGVLNNFDIEKLRYHKVIIMADADVDGAHIMTLLVTLFSRFVPELIENGHIYLANPPLYKVVKGRGDPVYLQTDEDKKAFFADKDESKWTVSRFKGLGEMNPEQLWETTMDPETRSLSRLTPSEDRKEDEDCIELLMGNVVEPRREFIEANAQYANLDV